MKVTSRILLIVSGIVSIVAAFVFFIFSIVFLVASAVDKAELVRQINDGTISAVSGMTADAQAERIKMVAATLAIVFIITTVASVLCAVFSFIATKSNPSTTIYVLVTVFSLLSTFVGAVGAIFGLVAKNKATVQSQSEA